MQIFIVTISGKTITLDVDASTTITELKQYIKDKEGYHKRRMRLVFNGNSICFPGGPREEEDGRTIRDYSIIDQSKIYLSNFMRGGEGEISDSDSEEYSAKHAAEIKI